MRSIIWSSVINRGMIRLTHISQLAAIMFLWIPYEVFSSLTCNHISSGKDKEKENPIKTWLIRCKKKVNIQVIINLVHWEELSNMSKCHLSACSIIQLRSDLEIDTRKTTSTWESSWQIETTSDYSFNDMIIVREKKNTSSS